MPIFDVISSILYILGRISDKLSPISDIAVFALTIYTFHITAVSRKLGFISMGQKRSMFYGDNIFLSLKNETLHSIPVTNVFLLKKANGRFYNIEIAKYEQPLVIDAWHIGKVEPEAYTELVGYKEIAGTSELYNNAVLGVNTGDKVVWLTPYKRVPLRYAIAHRAALCGMDSDCAGNVHKKESVFSILVSEIRCKVEDKALMHEAKKAYWNHDFNEIMPYQYKYNNTVLSKGVDYVITLLCADLNGNKTIETVYVLVGTENIILSDAICGHNGISDKVGNSAEEMESYLCEHFGIDKKNIRVDKIKHMI